MKFIFGFIGLLLGAAMGGSAVALLGAVIGVVIATKVARSNAQDDAAEAALPEASRPEPTTRAWTPPPLIKPVSERLANLEDEVAALRGEVARLRALVGGDASMPAEEIAPAPLPTVQAPAPKPARQTWNPPRTAAVAAPSAVVQPLPVPSAEPADQPEPLGITAVTPAPPKPKPKPKPVPEPVPEWLAKAVVVPPQPSLEERLPAWLRNWLFGGNAIVKVGVLILFLGLAFLLRYATEGMVVPVELRYAGVALMGLVLLVVGWHLRARRDAAGGVGYGLILQGAGIGVFYLTTLAALKLNALLPPELAFGLFFAIAILSAALAVAQNAPWLAYVAAAEGFAAPVLVSTGGGNHIALFSYLAILDLGIVLIAWFRAWRPLNVIAASGTFTLAAAWAAKHYSDALYPSTQAFLLLFFALFTTVSVLFARKALALGAEPDANNTLATRAAQALRQVGRVDSSLVFGVPLAAFGLQYLMVQRWEYGPAWAAAAFSAFYLLLGGVLLRGATRRYALLGETFVILSVIFGTLAIPLALEGEWTGATWAIEAAGMYWLGVRQQRLYSRAFALLVLLAAAARLFTALGLDFAPGAPLLSGSLLSLLMLGASALALFAVAQRARDDAPECDAAGRIAALWIGVAAFACVPWLLLTPLWAAVTSAAFALACALWALRRPLPTLPLLAAALHGVAVAGFASTLHRVAGAAMLSNGWEGLIAALLIGGSLLASAALPLRTALRAGSAATPQVSPVVSAGLLLGMAVVSLSLLFVMPADAAARCWPWLGVAALWLGLRLAQPALALAWAALQGLACVAFAVYGPTLWSGGGTALTLWTPLALTLAALLSGDLLRAAAGKPEPAAWLRTPSLQWLVVVWSLAWWSLAALPDFARALQGDDPAHWTQLWPTVLTVWVLLTSLLATLLARWRDWRVLGQASFATVPGWVLTAALGAGGLGFAPHMHGGWIAWPLALLWHGLLLRGQPRWVAPAFTVKALTPLHVLGFWLFLLLATREAQWWSAGWGEPGSAWPTLGWVLVPAAVLALLGHPALRRRWPLADFGKAYLLIACAPVAAYLLLWLWGGNMRSGEAAPLPYVPLLNPLELGQALVLLALILWRRAWPASAQAALPRPLLLAVLGATAFALYTGMVLRCCHHWAGVPWSAQALFASKLTQAALSVAWAIVGVALMLMGHRRVQRVLWGVGAVLLAVVVAKLFFVELADRGGLYRIISFIVVGLLLLLVGYFAPVPPSLPEAQPEEKPA